MVFALKGPVKEFNLWNAFNTALFGVWFLLVFEFELAKFSPQR